MRRPTVFSCTLFLALCASFLALQGCGIFSDSDAAQDNEPSMQIVVQLQDLHLCSVISPEIQVHNPPKGTTMYDVRLFERNGESEVLLGSGSWVEDGSGIIPEGALTGRYRGPCPPDGKRREYVFVVSAHKGDETQPLAVRLFTFVQE